MPVNYEEMPMERIELNIEITHHPLLIVHLQLIRDNSYNWDWTTMLAGVAAYCEVALDGDYTPEDLNKLCTILTQKLRDKRALVATPIPDNILQFKR